MDWYRLKEPDVAASPALLIYPDRIRENISRMIAIAGTADRLRPHVKTHKMAEVTQLQMAAGISRFKCATIAEAEMLARAGASDVLIAYPPVGPTITRFLKLVATFPQVAWSITVDHEEQVGLLDHAARDVARPIDVLLDIDNGMHRTGIAPGPAAAAVYRRIAGAAQLRPAGLHVYDGHLRDAALAARKHAVDEAFAAIVRLRDDLVTDGLSVPRIVAGGTFSFPIHAQRGDVELSPGTPILWDHGYATLIPDLDFLPAAVLVTRVVSRPGPGLVCLDLGYKALSADRAGERVFFPDAPDARAPSDIVKSI